MTDEDKKEFLKHSETLKKHALELFEGENYPAIIYALVMAAASIILEDRKNYKQSVYGAKVPFVRLSNM